MLFGSTDGFLLFTPSKVRFNTNKPKAYFPDIVVNNARLPDAAILGLGPMVFSHRQNNLEAKFSCNSYLKAENNRYAYRMRGLSDSWVPLPPLQKTVQFFNLPPGKYVLEVKASNSDGIWATRWRRSRSGCVLILWVRGGPIACMRCLSPWPSGL
jgi:hypothetical protein